jgi:hypothetical protein
MLAHIAVNAEVFFFGEQCACYLLVRTAPNILVSQTWLAFQLHGSFYRKFSEKLQSIT